MAQKFTVPITVKQLTSASSDAVTVFVDADTQARLKIEAGGRLTWGSGASAGDVNLYRSAADTLSSDDTLKVPTLFVDNIEVDTTGATTNQVLKFDGTKFVPGTASTVGSIDDLSDVVITNPLEFQTLEYDGTNWVNANAQSSVYVRNAEATTITTGTAVYLFGATGDHATVKRADNTLDTTSSKTIGLVSNNILASENGVVVTQGYVDGINLSTGYASGDVLWLGKNGQFTKTKPTAPDHLVFIGVVVRATNNGIVYVATQNGYELDELHNVSIPSANVGDVLTFNGSLWTAASAGGGASLEVSATAPASPEVGALWFNSATLETYIYYDNHWLQVTGEPDLVEDLTDLSDVTLTSVTSGQFLKFDGTKWVNDTVNGGAIISTSAPASPQAGQFWFDSDTAQTFVYYDSQWIEVGASGMSVTVSESAPASPIAGQIWFNSLTAGTYVYYDSQWIEVGASGVTAGVSDTAPAAPVSGQLWFNSLTGGTYIYYGTTWIEIGATPVNSLLNVINAKGDLLVGTADNVVGGLTAGSTGQVLTVDSSTATGLKWSTPVSTGKAIAMSIVFGS